MEKRQYALHMIQKIKYKETLDHLREELKGYEEAKANNEQRIIALAKVISGLGKINQ